MKPIFTSLSGRLRMDFCQRIFVCALSGVRCAWFFWKQIKTTGMVNGFHLDPGDRIELKYTTVLEYGKGGVCTLTNRNEKKGLCLLTWIGDKGA